jgi:hypothetical protein
VSVDRARVIAAGDDAAAHQDASYERGALDYVLSLTRQPLAATPEPITPEALAALPFADAAGRHFEVRGRAVELVSQEFHTETQRLWSLLLEGESGARVLVLKHGLAADPGEGRPRSVEQRAPDLVREGDFVGVRGLYLQRRVGTVGEIALPGPTPVLVAGVFRKLEPARPPITKPQEASWETVEDRFLMDTKRWDEPATFQILQWAGAVGHEKIAEDIASGALPWQAWDRDTFGTWGAEIKVTSAEQPRPFTEGARGKLWRLDAIVGQVAEEGWETVPSNPWGVDHLWVVDLLPEDYTYLGKSLACRSLSPFPPSAFPGLGGARNPRVFAYGFFVKNHTLTTQWKATGGEHNADLTSPMFVVVHMEAKPAPGGDSTTLWWVAASMALMGVVFYLTLIRSERKEASKMEAYRIGLRQRMRAKGQGHSAEPRGAPPKDAPPAGEGGGEGPDGA